MARILIVDDEPGVLEFLEELVASRGHEVETAGSGQEAVAKARAWSPHLMLLDVRMPGMDGIEALVKIREFSPDLPVLMMTAVKEEEVARQAMDLGAFDYITKPVSLDRLEMLMETKLIEVLGE